MINETSYKLFYNKFLYKIELYTAAAFLFRNKDLKLVKTTIDTVLQNIHLIKNNEHDNLPELPHMSYSTQFWFRRYNPSEDDIKNCQNLHHYLSVVDSDAKVRVELNNLSIYSNKKNELMNLGKNLSGNHMTFYQPDPNAVSQLKPNTIFHNFANKYKYRITIGKVFDNSLADYISNNNENFVKAGSACLQSIKNRTTGSYTNYYFYVRDDKILNILSMFGFEIKRIEELLPKSDK